MKIKRLLPLIMILLCIAPNVFSRTYVQNVWKKEILVQSFETVNGELISVTDLLNDQITKEDLMQAIQIELKNGEIIYPEEVDTVHTGKKKVERFQITRSPYDRF